MDRPESGRDHRDEDLQVYPDRGVEDLSSACPDLKGEGDLLRVCPVSAGQTCKAGFENILSWVKNFC